MISCQWVSDIATLLKLLIKQVILEERASSDDATTWVWNGRQIQCLVLYLTQYINMFDIISTLCFSPTLLSF